MTLAHFVITRFCLRDRWLHRRAALAPFRTMDPLAPRTVDLRLGLLETVCLPALRAQTNRDFTWVLLIDRALGPEARRRLRDMTRGMDRVRLVEYRADAPLPLERLDWLRPFPAGAPDYVLTTLNDDDDALPRRWVEVVQSHVRGLAGRSRPPPFLLAGARRIVQWDMVFTPDAPLGWAGPWRGLASVASCGFSLLCRWPAFDLNVLGLSHVYAHTYGDFLEPPPDGHVRLVRQRLLRAARNARAGRIPAARDVFFDASRDAGAVVMANHGGNFQPWRLDWGRRRGRGKHGEPAAQGACEPGPAGPAGEAGAEAPASERDRAGGRRPPERIPVRRVQGAATFPDVEIDWQDARRHRRHFRPWRVRARLLEFRLHRGREAAARRLRGWAGGVRSWRALRAWRRGSGSAEGAT